VRIFISFVGIGK